MTTRIPFLRDPGAEIVQNGHGYWELHRDGVFVLALNDLQRRLIDSALAAGRQTLCLAGGGAASTADSTGRAAVDRRYPWLPIDAQTPRGVKLQLICRASGVAHYGRLGTAETFFTHWAPLPTFED